MHRAAKMAPLISTISDTLHVPKKFKIYVYIYIQNKTLLLCAKKIVEINQGELMT